MHITLITLIITFVPAAIQMAICNNIYVYYSQNSLNILLKMKDAANPGMMSAAVVNPITGVNSQ